VCHVASFGVAGDDEGKAAGGGTRFSLSSLRFHQARADYRHTSRTQRRFRAAGMARKNKAEATPNATNVANRDILQRLNFLYQASIYLNAIGPGPGPGPSAIKPDADDDGKKKKRRQRRLTAGDLSREYVKDMKLVARKTTVRMCVPSP
jgi:hypothetical protein